MVTIKGPLHFRKGFSTNEFMKEHAEDIKIKLPFTATGWQSTKIPAGADLTGIELKKDEPKKAKPVKEKMVKDKVEKKVKKKK